MCLLSFIICNVNYLHKHMMDNMKKMKTKYDFQLMSLVVYAINFNKKTNEPKK
jgi:autonomous glycyl radical cofactor GrcA